MVTLFHLHLLRSESTIYNDKGEDVTNSLTAEQKAQVKAQTEYVDEELSLSDKIITGDLLRFYTPEGFKATDKTKYKL